ncbi:MAG: hypothetical protein LLG37_06555, partial [Spirochaetia bacterium]|nr:hypothetical protein [Spirochaetia bacterium]
YIAMFLFMLITGNFRRYLKGFLFLTLFTLLFTSPLIYWNFTHDMATFKYLLVRGAPAGGFTLKFFGELLASQVGLIGILSVALMLPALTAVLKKREWSLDYAYTTLTWACLLPFFLLSIKSRVEANWPAFAFLPAFFLASGYLSRLENPLRGRITTAVLCLGVITALIGHILAANPILPEKMNPLRKSMGYKELAQKVHEIYNKTPDKDLLFLSSRHYQTASLLSFYTPGQPEYYILLTHESNKNYRFWKGYKNFKDGATLFVYSEPWETWDMEKFFASRVSTEQVTVETPPYGVKRFCIDYFKGLK